MQFAKFNVDDPLPNVIELKLENKVSPENVQFSADKDVVKLGETVLANPELFIVRLEQSIIVDGEKVIVPEKTGLAFKAYVELASVSLR